MANYTRHDRNTKGNYVFHTSHLLPDGRSRHPIISHGADFVNEAGGAAPAPLLDPMPGSCTGSQGGTPCLLAYRVG